MTDTLTDDDWKIKKEMFESLMGKGSYDDISKRLRNLRPILQDAEHLAHIVHEQANDAFNLVSHLESMGGLKPGIGVGFINISLGIAAQALNDVIRHSKEVIANTENKK